MICIEWIYPFIHLEHKFAILIVERWKQWKLSHQTRAVAFTFPSIFIFLSVMGHHSITITTSYMGTKSILRLHFDWSRWNIESEFLIFTSSFCFIEFTSLIHIFQQLVVFSLVHFDIIGIYFAIVFDTLHVFSYWNESQYSHLCAHTPPLGESVCAQTCTRNDQPVQCSKFSLKKVNSIY